MNNWQLLRRYWRQGLKDPKTAATLLYTRFYNRRALRKINSAPPPGNFQELNEVNLFARRNLSAISEFLPHLFLRSWQRHPRLIVELGVRSGDSTFALIRAARLREANLVSVDLEMAPAYPKDKRAYFIKEDDIQFGRRFTAWCAERQIQPEIDVLFIDTSHEFAHTCEEIATWFPYLSPEASVFFHDTHLRPLYRRQDGLLGLGWDNKRGVIRALEQYFGCDFNETADFKTICNGWLIEHQSQATGFTTLTRLPKETVHA